MARNRSRKRRVARKRRETASKMGWGVLLAVLLALFGIGGWFAWSYASSRTVYDEVTLCPKSGATGSVVVLLDLTDPLTDQQSARLRTMLNTRVDKISEGTMISFGVVSSDPDLRGAIFSSCKPADGKQASQIYENPMLIAQRFKKTFLEPLHASLDKAINTAVEDRSPIMESLQAVIAKTPAFETAKGMREIVIVSDLLQNSETLSFYRGEGWEALRNSGGVGRLSHNLNDAWISIIRVPRPDASAQARGQVDDFWGRYFDQQGARAPITMTTLGDL